MSRRASPERDQEELVLRLSHLPIDEFDEQVALFNQPTTVTAEEEANLPALPTEVRIYLLSLLPVCTAEHANVGKQ